ncbi:MAG: twin-arginine translocase TatA/TatE family subunit [Pseudonocardiaceae bacterium]|nr:twin-arginine translocase TatA/TatE family subunit [Pseudonocardiaceae bacterium]
MPGIPGGWELVLLLVVLVVLFGASKLPNAARSIGQSMRIFKAETKSMRPDEGQAKNEGGTPAQHDDNQALPPSAQSPSTQTDTSRPAEQPHRTDTSR